MVHAQGPMLLSRKQSDGTNVAVHELAHVLDLADGDADGTASFWGTFPGWEALVKSRLKKVRKGGRGPRCAPTPAPTRPSCSPSRSRPSSRRPTSSAPATRRCSLR